MTDKTQYILWITMAVGFMIAWISDSTKWTLAILGLWLMYATLDKLLSDSKDSDKEEV